MGYLKQMIVVLALVLALAASAQQPQTSDVTNTQPLYPINAKYVQGIGPGYWPTAGAGLTLNISAGTAWCLGSVVSYAGGTLTMSNSATNYVYLNSASSCAPASNTSSFSAANVPIAVVVTSGGAITTITDDRGVLAAFNAGSLGGAVTSVIIAPTTNQINVSGTCTITSSGTCTLSLPNGVILGTDNSAAGTLQLANGAANAHNIFGSGATTSNTILGFATAPTTGHLVDCTTSSTTCTLHDSGVVTANVVNAASPGAGYAHFAGSTQSETSVTIPRAIPFSIGDPAGSALTVASTTTDYVTVPFGCTISAYNLVVDAGTITVKFWRKATGTAIPTSSDSISTSGVSISSGTAIHSATTSDFTSTTVTANDIIAMNVTAVSTAKFVNGVLQCDESQ